RTELGGGRRNVASGGPVVGRIIDAQRRSVGIGIVDAGDGGGRVSGFVEYHSERVIAEQVDAIEARVGRKLANLREQRVKLRRQGRTHRRIGRLVRLAGQ